MRVLALLAAAVPFGFGLIRFAQTGTDTRYLVVALAALIGTLLFVRMAPIKKMGALVSAATVFVIATCLALADAMLMGTRLGLGILIVAAAFGACFAAATWFYARGTTT